MKKPALHRASKSTAVFVIAAPATVTSSDNGAYVCYQVAGASSIGGWYSPSQNANATAVRAGLWPTAVTLTNHVTNNSIAAGDAVLITFNQNIATSGGTFRVCAFTSGGTLILGDLNNCTSTSDAYSIGKITGLTFSRNVSWASSNIHVAGAVATVTITGQTATVATEGGSGTFAPPTTTNSIITTPGAPSIRPCTLANCTATPSSHF